MARVIIARYILDFKRKEFKNGKNYIAKSSKDKSKEIAKKPKIIPLKTYNITLRISAIQ